MLLEIGDARHRPLEAIIELAQRGGELVSHLPHRGAELLLVVDDLDPLSEGLVQRLAHSAADPLGGRVEPRLQIGETALEVRSRLLAILRALLERADPVLEPDRRHRLYAEQFCGLDAAVAGDDAARAIY